MSELRPFESTLIGSSAEGEKFFSDDRVYLERYLEDQLPRLAQSRERLSLLGRLTRSLRELNGEPASRAAAQPI